MPFCPSCRYEYRSGIDRCPDCGEKLVDKLPDPETEEQERYDWVPLARLNSYDLAEMVIEAMENEGIPVLSLSGAGHFGVTGQMGMSSYRPIGGGYSIVVPSDRIAEADRVGLAVAGEEWAAARLLEISEEDNSGDQEEPDKPG
jgi:hypothetical protein